MIKVNKEQSIPEVGDDYEFCKIVDGSSRVYYGRIKAIDKANKKFTFERLDNGLKKNPTGIIVEDVDAIRGIWVHPDTWLEKGAENEPNTKRMRR